jgi:hypothetical protein
VLKGLLLQESLEEPSVLELLRITNTEVWRVANATADQPTTWTAVSFEVESDQADRIAEKLSQVLKSQGWYISACTTTKVYVIFPRKIYKYRKGDSVQRDEARRYGRSVGIPESQLDWSE